MRLRITVLPGDGIGPEIVEEAIRVLDTVAEINGHQFEFVTRRIGAAAIRSEGAPITDETLDTCLSSHAVLLGAVGDPSFEGAPPASRPEAGLLRLRSTLGAFANLRPAVAYDALADRSPLRPEVVAGADLLVVRELLGGIYFGAPRGIEHTDAGDSAYNTCRYSEAEIERIAHVAFQIARGRRRRRVTSVDKANVLETSVLWRSVVTRVAKEYPEVALDHVYVDACAMFLVTDPRRFDVLLTENLFGDILSDQAAGLGGSLGLLGSASIGGPVGIYEPIHGSAPDIAGRGIANPIGTIASAAMLLRHAAGLEQEAADVEAAIRQVLDDGHRTPDLCGGNTHESITTVEMGRRIAETLAEVADMRHPYHAV